MIKLNRVAQGKQSTLSMLYIDQIFECYILEDAVRPEKIKHETCIPEGSYILALNRRAGMNTRYQKDYPQLHQGMVEVTGIQEYSLVFFHTGNAHTDTSGCLLVGDSFKMVDGDYRVEASVKAYRKVYPQFVKCIRQGEVEIVVQNHRLYME